MSLRRFKTACLFACLISSSCDKNSTPDTKPITPADFPNAVELSLSGTTRIVADPAVGGCKLRLTTGPDGTVWMFLAKYDWLAFAVYRDNSWSDIEEIAEENGSQFFNIQAAVGANGNPVIICAGIEVPGVGCISEIHWTGKSWTKPHIIDRIPVLADNSLQCVADRDGLIHVVYRKPLAPPEFYGSGPHGQMHPDKSWHTMLKDGRWSQPQATTGREKYHADPADLSLGPDGVVVLGLNVRPFRDTSYVGEQVWNGNSWTPVTKYMSAESGGLIASAWGDRLVWWRNNGTSGVSLIRGQSEEQAPQASLRRSEPVVVDSAGRIIVCDHMNGDANEVRVWNGKIWSDPLHCDDATAAVATIDGQLFLGRWEHDGVHIQKIHVKEVPASTSPDRPDLRFVEKTATEPPDILEAVKSRDLHKARSILSNNPSLARQHDRRRVPVLHIAALNKDTQMVKLLLDSNADPNAWDLDFQRPLHIAAKNGSVDIARLLLGHGARVNDEDKKGNTPQAYAQAANNHELVGLFGQYGGTAKDYLAEMIRAISAGDRETVAKLLERGVSVESQVPNGHCLLDYAAEGGDVAICTMLIAHGANAARSDDYQRTALYWACGKGKAEMVAFLVKHGADPNAREWEGKTPLHSAIYWSQSHPDEALATVVELIIAGADVNTPDNKGVTPLVFAQTYGTDEIRGVLIENGAGQ